MHPLPPDAPNSNGVTGGADLHHFPEVNGEDGASREEASSLAAVCADFHSRVTAFLNRDSGDELIKRVQEQVRKSMKVIQEALKTYEYVLFLLNPSFHHCCSFISPVSISVCVTF